MDYIEQDLNIMEAERAEEAQAPRKESVVSSEGNEEAERLEEQRREDARSIYIENV